MPHIDVYIRTSDISPEFDAAMRAEGVAAWDLETDGLDFTRDRIRTCQIYVPGTGVEIVQISDKLPTRLSDALMSERVTKIFHHAPFDLRFMRFWWGARARNVVCTKVAAKIIYPNERDVSLKALVGRLLDVNLDKTQRLSDWSRFELGEDQIRYAANDVVHLPDLLRVLWKEALNIGVGDLLEQSFSYLPVRVETELLGAEDVFAY